ncbi:hypothetical protein A3A66_02580 [Microgenomates group bacterium RIFCSPLOWO2_01_FULL_46_13]|nr:MAG: hypothetical protein A2783_03165 [Microgenomates group bacterium RIFCSPHIGHO2_01_FULL_45_11]OGV94857.1 MAG: hypothetical protein A3A66_02580 [Microgenomates group bacterium RIFCSPLOWO2_01_FULL_46_13]
MNVFIIAAQSADGFIARNSNEPSINWTSKEDKEFFQERTKKAGVIVVGSKTFATFRKPLPDRLNIVYTRHPEKIPISRVIRTSSLPPEELIRQLEKERYSEVAVCGGSQIYTMFMEAGVVNKLYLTVEPMLFGKGIKLFDKAAERRLELVQVKNLNRYTLLLEYNLL